MPPAPRPITTPEWRALVQYRIEQVEIDVTELRGRVASIEARERDSIVDAAELRGSVVTRSQAPEILEAAKLREDERTRQRLRETRHARIRQAGWSLFLLAVGFALHEGWAWYVGPK